MSRSKGERRWNEIEAGVSRGAMRGVSATVVVLEDVDVTAGTALSASVTIASTQPEIGTEKG